MPKPGVQLISPAAAPRHLLPSKISRKLIYDLKRRESQRQLSA